MSSQDFDSSFLEHIIEKIYNGKLGVQNKDVGVLDVNWYEEYHLLYDSDPFAVPYAKRIVLEDENEELYGIVNLRPSKLSTPYDHSAPIYDISEFYVSPPEQLNDPSKAFVKCMDFHDCYGYSIKCTPFIMPNPFFGVCGEAAAWICLKTLNEFSGHYVPSKSIPEIQRSVTGHTFTTREGMKFTDLSLLLKACNCAPFIYKKRFDEFEEIFNIVYSYVESGFPVIIGIEVASAAWWKDFTNEVGYHAIVVIGHTMDENSGEIDGFIVHDESTYPYLSISKEELKDMWGLFVTDKETGKLKEEPAFIQAVAGLPLGIGVGYEEILKDLEVWLFVLRSKGLVDRIDYPVWPILTPLKSFLSRLDSFFEDEEFSEPLRNKIKELAEKDLNFPAWVWELRILESNERRKERKIDGFLLFDAVTAREKPIFAAFEEAFIQYIDPETSRIVTENFNE